MIQKLFISKSYAWYLLSNFFSLFNDNLYRSALIVFLTYHTAQWTTISPTFLVQIIAAVYIICPFLFSGLAGQWGDKVNKKHFIIVQKIVEFILAVICFFSLIFHNLFVVLACVGLYGLVATFAAPVRISMIPQILAENQLLRGNSLLTIINLSSLILGAGFGAYLITFANYTYTVGICLIVGAALGLAASLFLPAAKSFATDLQIDGNIFRSTKKMILYPFSQKHFFIVIFLNAWFWFLSSVYQTQSSLLAYALNGNETVVGLFFVVFVLGAMIGAMICSLFTKVLHLWICGGGGLIIALAGLDAHNASLGMSFIPRESTNWWYFLQNFAGLRLSFDIFMVGVGSGIWVVPLYVFLQIAAPPEQRAQALAANCVWSAILVAGAACFAGGLSLIGFNVYEVLMSVVLFHILICACFFFFLPGSISLFFKGRPLKNSGA